MSTWLLLRGLTRETRHWGEFPAIFQAYAGDANVIAIDLPGNGSLHHLPSPACVAGMVAHCRAELGRLGIGQPCNLIAMSLGAMVATEWAARHPGEIERCVLINTSMRPFSAFYQRLRPANYFALLRLAVGGGTAERWERTILRITSGLPHKHANVLAKWVAYRTQYPVSRGNALRQLFAAARYRAPTENPLAKALILTSTRDALVATCCSLALAAAWGVPAMRHPDAGHDIPLDDPHWLARQIGDWLAGSEPG